MIKEQKGDDELARGALASRRWSGFTRREPGMKAGMLRLEPDEANWAHRPGSALRRDLEDNPDVRVLYLLTLILFLKTQNWKCREADEHQACEHRRFTTPGCFLAKLGLIWSSRTKKFCEM